MILRGTLYSLWALINKGFVLLEHTPGRWATLLGLDCWAVVVTPWLLVSWLSKLSGDCPLMMRSATPKAQTNFLSLLRAGGYHAIGFPPGMRPSPSTEGSGRPLYQPHQVPVASLLVRETLALRKILQGSEVPIPFWILPLKIAGKLNSQWTFWWLTTETPVSPGRGLRLGSLQCPSDTVLQMTEDEHLGRAACSSHTDTVSHIPLPSDSWVGPSCHSYTFDDLPVAYDHWASDSFPLERCDLFSLPGRRGPFATEHWARRSTCAESMFAAFMLTLP